MKPTITFQQTAQIERTQIDPVTHKRDLMREWSFPVGYTTTATMSCQHGSLTGPAVYGGTEEAMRAVLALHAERFPCGCAALYARGQTDA